MFVDNFFTNTRLFNALKTINIGACGTAKAGSGFSDQLLRMRVAATKQTDWWEMGLMTTESSKKFGVDDGDILYMAWVDLNTVQYMTTCHIFAEMKTIIYKDEKCRHVIPKTSVVFDENETPKLSFPMPIVEYNTYMGGSDGNAQQRSYYSSHRANSRYWWPLFIFLLESAVLNAFKLWQLINPFSKLTHLEFQRQLVEALLAPAGQSRKRSLAIELC